MRHDHKFIDLSGKKFDKWTVIRADKKVNQMWKWLCMCSCGKIVSVYGTNLRRGLSTGCGHGRIPVNKTHGLTRTRPYRCYRNMLNRCNNPNVPEYKYYGARGIKVCESWNTFEEFWKDMQSGYKEILTLDRIDVNGNYCKNNCRWVTQLEQVNNVRNNKILELNGVRDTLPNWARKLKMNRATLSSRIYLYGWGDKKSLTTPVLHYKKTQ